MPPIVSINRPTNVTHTYKEYKFIMTIADDDCSFERQKTLARSIDELDRWFDDLIDGIRIKPSPNKITAMKHNLIDILSVYISCYLLESDYTEDLLPFGSIPYMEWIFNRSEECPEGNEFRIELIVYYNWNNGLGGSIVVRPTILKRDGVAKVLRFTSNEHRNIFQPNQQLEVLI